MDGGEIPAETFPIEPGNPAQVRGLRQIKSITDRYDRRRHFKCVGFSNGESRCGLVHLQDGCPAADIRHELARRIFPTVEFDCEIASVASDSVRGVKRPCWVDEESGAANLAVLIDAMNLHNRFGGSLEKVADLMADRRRGGLVLREQQACARTENDRER